MGVLFSLINEAFPPKTKFNVDDIPDLTGKVIIVTGANAGQSRLCLSMVDLNNVCIIH